VKVIDSALHHRVLVPQGTVATVHPTLILLHGRGADEEDLLGLSSSLDERFLILSARAPYPFPFGGGFTWYNMDDVGTPEPAMFKSSYGKLTAFIDDALAQYPVNKRQLYLLGFSMGTVMSYVMALTKPIFRGVVANSGYIPERTDLVFRWELLGATEFFVTHGTMDPVIPVALGRRARELLGAQRIRCEYKEYPMGHQISDESLTDAADWLRKRIDPSS
jgi:phospholipase/carboxylesterase